MISVCHEPGCHTIFQEASPTFKKRFMYMSGITDEAEFDKMRQGMTWEGHADKVKVEVDGVRRELKANILSVLTLQQENDGKLTLAQRTGVKELGRVQSGLRDETSELIDRLGHRVGVLAHIDRQRHLGPVSSLPSNRIRPAAAR